MIERGPDVSFANCGLPYFIGGEIKQRDALAVQTPQTLKAMLALEVRTSTEAIAIDRAGKRVQLREIRRRHHRVVVVRQTGTRSRRGAVAPQPAGH